MDVIYENEMYKVIANIFDHQYMVVNKSTGIVESRESAEPTALFQADALLGALNKHHKNGDK